MPAASVLPGELPIKVKPLTIHPLKPGGFMHHPAASLRTGGRLPVGAKTHRTDGIEWCARVGVDIQPVPAHGRLKFQGFRAGAPMPGSQQVGHIPHGKGAKARAH